MLLIELLPWDSSFFNLKIGRIHIDCQDNDRLSQLLIEARADKYNLLYIFSSDEIEIDSELNNFLVNHVDLKITYTYAVKGIDYLLKVPTVNTFELCDNVEDLYNLSFQSGEFSRFKVDENFSENDFKKFYSTWVNNCLSGQMADIVFTYVLNGVIVGFITVKTVKNVATIGLLATDVKERKKGVGTILINHIKGYLIKLGVTTINVTTQGNNIVARNFYERNGFLLTDQINVYHCWL